MSSIEEIHFTTEYESKTLFIEFWRSHWHCNMSGYHINRHTIVNPTPFTQHRILSILDKFGSTYNQGRTICRITR